MPKSAETLTLTLTLALTLTLTLPKSAETVISRMTSKYIEWPM